MFPSFFWRGDVQICMIKRELFTSGTYSKHIYQHPRNMAERGLNISILLSKIIKNKKPGFHEISWRASRWKLLVIKNISYKNFRGSFYGHKNRRNYSFIKLNKRNSWSLYEFLTFLHSLRKIKRIWYFQAIETYFKRNESIRGIEVVLYSLGAFDCFHQRYDNVGSYLT